MKYLLDTHAWIWWNMRPAALSTKIQMLLGSGDPSDELLLSVISVWEFCKLIENRKLVVNVETQGWVSSALAAPRLTLVPLTPKIAYESTTLPGRLHRDPADQLIVATARVENAVLITRDKSLRQYRHIDTIW